MKKYKIQREREIGINGHMEREIKNKYQKVRNKDKRKW